MTDANHLDRRTFLTRSAATGGVVMLGATAAAGLAGCSSGSSGSSTTSTGTGSKPGVGTGTPVHGGSLTVGTLAEIDGFYPASNHWDTNGFLYAGTVYDPLLWVGADGSVKPYLATSVTPNSTFDVWTLTIRPGVKFHDGSDLTAAVVKANYDALLASPLVAQALLQVSSVATPDAMTVAFTLSAPNPTFPEGLTNTTQVGYIVGEAMIQAAAANPNAAPKPIGTGPFVYSDWQPNDHFTAVRNPNYWRQGLPYLDQITFRPIPDTTQREASLRSGAVDMIQSTDADTISRFSGSGGSGYQLVDTRTGVIGEPTVTSVMLNCAAPPTDDLRIRQALAKSLNTSEILAIYGGGFATKVTGLFLPSSPYYNDTKFPTYDPAGAKSLVDQYKAERGTPSIQLATIPDPLYVKLIQLIQQMWQQVGFEVTLTQVQQAQIIADFVTGNFHAVTLYQFGATNPDLNYVWFSTTTVKPIGTIGLNFPRNNDPQLESALLTGRHTTDQATRVKAYQTLNDRLAADLPYLWISQFYFSEVAANRVQNFANPVLPDGSPGYAYDEGVFQPTQVWLAR